MGDRISYFKLNDPEATAHQFVLNFGEEQESQGITTTDYTDFTDKAGGWYSFNGVRLNGVGAGVLGDLQSPVPARLRKGLYIVNGRKVVVP